MKHAEICTACCLRSVQACFLTLSQGKQTEARDWKDTLI